MLLYRWRKIDLEELQQDLGGAGFRSRKISDLKRGEDAVVGGADTLEVEYTGLSAEIGFGTYFDGSSRNEDFYTERDEMLRSFTEDRYPHYCPRETVALASAMVGASALSLMYQHGLV